jgi:hypothetical protein
MRSTIRFRRPALATSLALLLILATASAASAHEHREVGEYELTVGFSNEPALAGEPNGLSLAVQAGHGDEGTPVEGLEETLQAEISFGGETMPLELRASFGEPGAYTADVIPTETGAYTFRIFGTIEDMQVDESFTSGPETFSEVESTDAISFPAPAAGEEGATSAEDAKDTADSARTLAIIGLVAGVLGLIAGGSALAMAMSARAARQATTQPATGEVGD